MNQRSNTQLPDGHLPEDAVLCCGEDLKEFKNAINSVFGTIRHLHTYRCYSFYARKGVMFIWTGIGTGCLEPLLCEILDTSDLRRLILVGTAGAVRNKATLGLATPIREARLVCAGICPIRRISTPNWGILPEKQTQTIASTDYYYGFSLSTSWPTRNLWAADRRLPKSVSRSMAEVDLVDMETGQFYHLCHALRPDLKFIAIKGAANPVSDPSQQAVHSRAVLRHSLSEAKQLLATPK